MYIRIYIEKCADNSYKDDTKVSRSSVAAHRIAKRAIVDGHTFCAWALRLLCAAATKHTNPSKV